MMTGKGIELIERAKKESKGYGLFLEIIIFCGLFLFISIIIGMLLDLFHVNPDGGTYFDLLALLWSDLLYIVFFCVYSKYVEKRTLYTLGFGKNNCIIDYVKGLGIGLGLFSVVAAIGCIIGSFLWEGPSDNQDMTIILLLLSGFFVQGMGEEVTFRGFFFVSLARKSNIYVAIVLNSLLFGAVHGFNDGFSVLALINLFLFGVCATLLFLKTGSIWITGAMHSMWNFAEGNVFGFSVSGIEKMPTLFQIVQSDNDFLSGGAFGPEGGLAVTIALLFFIALMAYFLKRGQTSSRKG